MNIQFSATKVDKLQFRKNNKDGKTSAPVWYSYNSQKNLANAPNNFPGKAKAPSQKLLEICLPNRADFVKGDNYVMLYGQFWNGNPVVIQAFMNSKGNIPGLDKMA
ncbi:MAG: hypothetical protein QE263_04865 [Vampirovibrionales bacterium]|nr:hypothetical protein [Vampirovibrionales bacterium]